MAGFGSLRCAGRALVIAGAGALLSACIVTDTINEKSKIDYRTSGGDKRAPLDVPPDLAAPKVDDRFSVPESAGRRTYSGFAREQGAAPAAEQKRLLPTVAGVRLAREGQRRWLVVDLPAERVWPVVREFWQEAGFIVQSESPESGILETEWAENRAKLPQDFVRRTLGRVIDSLYSTGERDKFRTRLERSAAGTEIYISHRGMVEVYDSAQQDRTVWQPRPNDPELEVEFLRRLMVKFGVDAEESRKVAAAGAASGTGSRSGDGDVRLVDGADGAKRLVIPEAFERAWRRVGLALDRGGFTVEDRDRSKGVYFVRYVDPESDARREKEGFLSRVFGRSRQATQSEVFQILVASAGERSEVDILTRAGAAVAPHDRATTARMLSLIRDQMKP